MDKKCKIRRKRNYLEIHFFNYSWLKIEASRGTKQKSEEAMGPAEIILATNSSQIDYQKLFHDVLVKNLMNKLYYSLECHISINF